MRTTLTDQHEWLETDGLGGFASGTATGVRTRRYHGLLLAAVTPPTNRFMLVNGIDAELTTNAGTYPLSAQRYAGQAPDADHPKHLDSFSCHPWPTWRFILPDGVAITQQLLAGHESPVIAVSLKAENPAGRLLLRVRPLLSGRDYHALHHENPHFNFTPDESPGRLTWRPYNCIPAITLRHNGSYHHDPCWYRSFLYAEEALRGFDATEDLAAPGILTFDLAHGEAVLIFSAGKVVDSATAEELLYSLRIAECARRASFATRLHRAADQYLVRRGVAGRTIIAGYPWFADWGRDTFISLRGLCLSTGRLNDARDILISWAPFVSEGMLPNRFPDGAGDELEYNSVDASLWYVVAVCSYLDQLDRQGGRLSPAHRATLLHAIDQILGGYTRGARHGIAADDDGLLRAGAPGLQLTWMDARVDGRVITPRSGKPVEVQALWLNALALASRHAERWWNPFIRGRMSFRHRFFNPATHGLYDVIDVDHRPGRDDPTIRPNQIFAVGGLPLNLLERDPARSVVHTVERHLLTPLGLRSLAPNEPGYAPRYAGGPAMRDAVYHQGTVWPWLLAPFVEAWLRVRDHSPAAKAEARHRFLNPLLAHLDAAGLDHVSEIADADAPHMPRGCPFQAWSVAELLRLDQDLLSSTARPAHIDPHPVASDDVGTIALVP